MWEVGGSIHNHEPTLTSDYVSIHQSPSCVMPFRSQAKCGRLEDRYVAGCRGINNSTLANVLPSCTETEHSQQEVLTLTQMSSPATTDTNATQHPDTTRPGNASKRADSAHKQPTGRLRQHAFTSAPLSAFLRRITRLTTERELRTPRVPATQQQ